MPDSFFNEIQELNCAIIKISIIFKKIFQHSKSEDVKLLGKNLQLISSFQKLSPVKVNKLFHCVKSCCRHDLIFIQCINFEELKIHKLTVVLWLLQARLKEHKFPNFVKLTLILNGGVLSATSGYLEHYDRHTCMQVLSTILVQKSEQVLLFLPQRS